jgi:transposase
MPKNEELTDLQRANILGLHMSNNSLTKISKLLKIPRSTVHGTITRCRNNESLKSAPRSGRPKAINEDDQKFLKELVQTYNHRSANEIKTKFAEATGIEVSTKTIRKNFHELGIFSRITAVKPLLTEKQRKNRLKWCLERRAWTVAKWKTVIWSDESRFKIFRNDGPNRVWRIDGTRYNVENMVPSVKHGGGGIMVWGCFSGKGLGPLVKVEGKMNRLDYIKILEKNLLPTVEKQFNDRRYLFNHQTLTQLNIFGLNLKGN